MASSGSSPATIRRPCPTRADRKSCEPAAPMDRQAGLAALFLLLTPGPLAEVLSQNVPLSTFVQPVPFLLLTLTYGVPLLVIRELSVARELDEVGLVVLGLAYGILNEGGLAKTLTLPDGAPLHDFAGYGQVGPIQG